MKDKIYTIVRQDLEHSSVVVPEEYEVECYSTDREELEKVCAWLNKEYPLDDIDEEEYEDYDEEDIPRRWTVEPLPHVTDWYYYKDFLKSQK